MYRLRELERRDIPEINRWRNDPEVISLMGAPFRYIGIDIDYAWFDNYLKNRNNTIRCSIVDEDDRLVGLVSLTGIDQVHRSAEIHCMIGNITNRGKGIGTFALTEIMRHGFMNHNLNRVEFGCLEEHTASRRMVDKIGFTIEGMKRGAKYKDGKFHNVIIGAMLKEDFVKLYGDGTNE